MTLAAGTRLGAYEILGPLGAGGMGEVYRARDPRLGREVAIKLVAGALAADPELLGRFEREGRLLAALNHPSIATIHGMEEDKGTRFLVLELVEGETLAERLSAGPLPLPEALEVCRQVADALAAAHEKDIVHRDLKPANIKFTAGGKVKVLDFGLAKSIDPASGANSALQTASGTRAGTVLGTPAYMSPEQARGKPVDRRTDIWSFGCVLFEAMTGRRAFPGETVSDTLAALLEHEPDWKALPPDTPPPISHLLHKCLEKDPNRRLRDAGDARLEIDDALASLSLASPGPGGSVRPSTRLLVLAAAVVAVVAVAFGLQLWRRGGAAKRAPKLSQATFAEGIEESPAWSPDGTRIVYSAAAGRQRKIFVKYLQTQEERLLTAGDFDDIQPAWSKDGGTVLFVRAREPGSRLEPGDVFGQYDGGNVWAVDVASGRETRLIENAFNPSFAPDGKRIALDASWAGPRRIWIVDAQGHNPQQATTDVSEAVAHVRPRWSPDGRRIVFQNIERTRFDVRALELASKGMVSITQGLYQNVDPVWSPSGRFIYFTSDRGGGWNLWRSGVKADGAPSGLPQQLTTGAGKDLEAALSPDGRRLAFAILKQNADLWKVPVSPESGRPAGEPQEVVGTTLEDSRGAWSPDGKTIAFNSDRSGEMNIWLRALDGSTRELTKGPGGDFQANWSPDGAWIAFFSSRSGNVDVWKVEVATGRLVQLTKAAAIDVNPFFSPDGRQIAYQSDEGGRLEVWVMNADGSQPGQLTRVGVSGHFLRWMPDGRSIAFRCPCGGKPQTMQVGVGGEDPQPIGEMAGGAHMSFAPDFSKIMDVLGHKALWISSLRVAAPEKVFEFGDGDVRIDYPVWSPDGRFVLFDRFRPQGGDIWLMEDFE